MSKETNISWTDHTFNIIWGCSRYSPGCAKCYAEALAARWAFEIWGVGAARRTFGEKYWHAPIVWNEQALREGRRHRVFSSSMGDIFEDHPTVAQERAKLWPLIRDTPWLDWQLLTKRAERIQECLPADWGPHGYPNVWMGVSVENQEWAEKRIPFLLRVNVPVRFLSAEPLLGSIQFTTICGLSFNRNPDHSMARKDGAGIGWVIFGGESGSGHRPCDPAWIESGVRQCRAAGVPAFVKQDGGQKPGQQGWLSDELFNTKEFPL
jgi:protein gp37